MAIKFVKFYCFLSIINKKFKCNLFNLKKIEFMSLLALVNLLKKLI